MSRQLFAGGAQSDPTTLKLVQILKLSTLIGYTALCFEALELGCYVHVKMTLKGLRVLFLSRKKCHIRD